MALSITSSLGSVDSPLRRLVNNQSKDVGRRNCEEELVLPERCSVRLIKFAAIQGFSANAPTLLRMILSAESSP